MRKYIRKVSGYILAFMVPVMILAIVYGIRGVYPIGSGSVLVLDLNAQYVYYYEAFRDAFLDGKSLFYSFSRTLGGGMMGIYAYYLASPFSFILLLFSKAHITEAILVMILIKVGCAGLTFFTYLYNVKKGEQYPSILFSTLYALMSYVIIQTMNPMWLDAVLFFPLLIIGIEKIIDEGRYYIYLVVLTLIFISNFYIGYMTGIFVFVYFLYYLFGESEVVQTLGSVIYRFILFGVSTVLAILMSSWLILPTYEALKLGKLTFTEPNFFPEQQFDLFQLFAKALPFSYDSVNFHGLPFIYSGLVVLILCGMYFLNDAEKPKKRIASAVFIVVFISCFTVSTVDIVLHGFQAPNWLNYRYSYILSFFLIKLASVAYKDLPSTRGKVIANSSLILVLLVALTGRNGFEFIIAENAIWYSYFGLLVYSLLLYGIKTAKHPINKVALYSILGAMIFTELILNTFQMTNAANAELKYSTRTSYVNYFEDLIPAVDYIEGIDDGFYRSETLSRRAVNDPMALGIYGLSNSSSILNSKAIDFLYSLGISSKSHWTKYKGTTIVSDSLLAIKYIILNVDEELNHDKYEIVYSQMINDEIISNDDGESSDDEEIIEQIHVSENPYALPVMFVANSELKDLKLDDVNPFINQNNLLNAILGQQDIEYFKQIVEKVFSLENLTEKKMEDCMKYTPINADDEGMITYEIYTSENNPMYMFLYSEYPRVVDLWKSNEYVDTFFDTNSRCIMPLGVNDKKDTIEVKTVLKDDEYYIAEALFYYLDMSLFEEAIETIREDEIIIDKVNETRIYVTVEANEGEMLYTSIPYEEGWQVKINNQRVKPIIIADTLMGIQLVEGKQEIVLKYVPMGLVKGMVLTFIGLALTIILIVINRKKGYNWLLYIIVKKYKVLDVKYNVEENTGKEDE